MFHFRKVEERRGRKKKERERVYREEGERKEIEGASLQRRGTEE
jgi:hypothetical protein